jgi:hypothetical protein
MIRHPSDADGVKILRLVRGEEAVAGATAVSDGALPQETIFAACAEVRLRQVFDTAGFASFQVAKETPFNLILQAHP